MPSESIVITVANTIKSKNGDLDVLPCPIIDGEHGLQIGTFKLSPNSTNSKESVLFDDITNQLNKLLPLDGKIHGDDVNHLANSIVKRVIISKIDVADKNELSLLEDIKSHLQESNVMVRQDEVTEDIELHFQYNLVNATDQYSFCKLLKVFDDFLY